MIEEKKTQNEKPKIIETKVVETPKTLTEDQQQEEYSNEQSKQFFDDEDEILEVNFD